MNQNTNLPISKVIHLKICLDFISAPIWPGVISKAGPDKKTNMLFFSGTCISQFLSKKCHFMKAGTQLAVTRKRMRGK